ncbi:MAG: hypothetical protein VB078_08875 [Clostridiaceae bacterium]|nr:hypothetical protein [Clostridiaceae bacterium]
MNKKRAFTTAILLLFIAALILSLAYITAEAEHHCTGESCNICHNIAVCIGIFTVSSDVALLSLYAFFAILVIQEPFPFCPRFCMARTLVSLKVKLSD